MDEKIINNLNRQLFVVMRRLVDLRLKNQENFETNNLYSIKDEESTKKESKECSENFNEYLVNLICNFFKLEFVRCPFKKGKHSIALVK